MPYLLITTFLVQPGNRARLEQVMDAASGSIRAQPGFRSLMLFISQDGSEGGALSIWDTRAQAQTITTVARDQAQHLLQDIQRQPPTTQIHEIYEPKGEPARSAR
jgi:heme-degrading monooxygenase HmoA